MDAFVFVGAGILLSSLFGCGNYQKAKHSPVDGIDNALNDDLGEGDDRLVFADVFAAVIEPRCLNCHAGYAEYSQVVGRIDEILRRVSVDDMPRGGAPLSVEQKALLRTWVEEGALFEVEAPAPPTREPTLPDEPGDDPVSAPVDPPVNEPIGLEPTWASISEEVFMAKCTVCHNPAGRASFLDLSTRLRVFEQRALLFNFDRPSESYLIERIVDAVAPMPPVRAGLGEVTDEEVATLIEWIRLGLP